MKIIRELFVLFFLFITIAAFSQEIQLSRAESEAVFLKENLHLIATRLEIDQTEAQVLQAKLWPNPTFEVERGILWNKDETEYFGDEISIEQLIQLAGKRKKLIALQKVSVEMSKAYFQEVLRNLKLEFRNLLTDYQYIQLKKELFQNQLETITKLTRAYKNQLDDGHISKGEYIRLKALELEIRKELKENSESLNEVEKDLKSLMHLSPEVTLIISPEGFVRNARPEQLLTFSDLYERAKETRPDFRLLALEKEYSDRNLGYQKAQGIPDLAVKLGYERGGNSVSDFIGLGFTIDLPVFDRNQGNIKHAKIEIDRVENMNNQKELELKNEIMTAYKNFQNALDFIENIEPDHEETLDFLFESYTHNFLSRNLNLLEYLDFFEAYLENKEILFDTAKDLNEKIEQLNYTLGQDLIKE